MILWQVHYMVKIKRNQILLNLSVFQFDTSTWNPLINGFIGCGVFSRFQKAEQTHSKDESGAVTVNSTLLLNLTSQHHKQNVICQAYNPVLEEGANTYYQLNVLRKCDLKFTFVHLRVIYYFFIISKWPRYMAKHNFKWGTKTWPAAEMKTALPVFVQHVHVRVLFTGNLCCDLWVCWALRHCVLIVHLLCCMAMFAFDAISQAAASLCFKAWCCVWAWRNVTVCLRRSAVGQQYCHSWF